MSSLSSLDHPSLRPTISVRLHEVENQQVLILECGLGVSEMLGLNPAVAPLLSLFDGRHSVTQIVERFSHLGVSKPLVEELVRLLEGEGYLAGPSFERVLAEHERDFRETSVRKPALAGRAYSANVSELRPYIDGLIGTAQSAEYPLALIAPHIDYRRGHEAYAAAYSRLPESSDETTTFILLGTSHRGGRSLFQFCSKDFACPLGTLRNNQTILTELVAAYGTDRALRDETLHIREHSLELQLPFLAARQPKARMVPILVGGFYDFLRKDREPKFDAEYQAFAGALRECVLKHTKNSERIVLVAGVDMAHVGKDFGDEFLLTPEKQAEIATRDEEYLHCIQTLDATALFAHIQSDLDSRRVCGFATIYTLLDVLSSVPGPKKVERFDYRQAVNMDTQCLVSFASIAIYEEK